jgi:hypothetical protein
MGFLKNKLGQGALEYLLIIGGAIILAAIVIAVVLNVTRDTKDVANNKFGDFNSVINGVIPGTDVKMDPTSERAAMVAFGDSYRNYGAGNPYNISSSAKISEIYVDYIKRSGYLADLNNYRYHDACTDKINLNCVSFTENLITKFDLGNIELRNWFYAGYSSGIAPIVGWETLNKCINDNNIQSCFLGPKYADMLVKTLTLN